MDMHVFEQATQDILTVLPQSSPNFARLRELAHTNASPIVTVIGKYNHGKSRLLNELIGEDVFAVADRRETIALAEHQHQQVRWLDAPGLDADVFGEDDHLAHEALWTQSDIRLFIHSVREGELDSAEHPLIQQLHQDQQCSQRQTLLVLTQIDQIADPNILADILATISQQVPNTPLFPVSATRHRQAIAGNKQVLLKKSGMIELSEALTTALNHVPQARLHEKKHIITETQSQLQQLKQQHQQDLEQLQQLQITQRQAFEQDLNKVLDKIQDDLQPLFQISGTDEALVPDSFENMFKMTAGKQERARIQVAYSRACIDINSHLIRYGVVGLPSPQQTNVRSLDTVMVAVMGVSVKFRDDLKKIFCSTSGRERLQREFAHYFELSSDREALKQNITALNKLLALDEKASIALQHLELELC
ncbi:GTPase [Acinetobacter defluvii]|uniref:GTPase n=1 Tax=Acinetobacter defluvii TaxID=1871111 RepID=UPI003AF5EB81